MRHHRALVWLMLSACIASLTACQASDPVAPPARWCGVDSLAVPLQGDSLRVTQWLIRIKRCR